MINNENIKSYYVENTKFSRIALSQVYDIIINYGEEVEKIPERIIKFLADNRDKEYVFDYNQEEIKLEKDAENLLIYIYTKYLAPEEEKIVLENMIKIQYEQKEREKEQKYNINIFEKEQNVEKKLDNQINQTNLPTEYKESIIKKILTFIKNLFSK